MIILFFFYHFALFRVLCFSLYVGSSSHLKLLDIFFNFIFKIINDNGHLFTTLYRLNFSLFDVQATRCCWSVCDGGSDDVKSNTCDDGGNGGTAGTVTKGR